jgi:murein DD-endopeptidase MepM/ murein hydrolase activator NlpD/beta-lactamase regulating signal transducer with metallopeptidase domain
MDFQMILKLSGKFFSLLRDEIYYAGIVFFIVWILTFLLKKKSPRWHYALWFLVLLRLILPPDLSFSLSGRNLIFQSLIYEKIVNVFEFFTLNPTLNITDSDSEFVSIEHEDQRDLLTKTKFDTRRQSNSDYFYLIFFVTWIIGVSIFLFIYIKKLHRFHSITKRAIVIDNTILNKISEDWRSFFRIKRSVCLVYSEEYLSPFTTGILRPIIYIPKTILKLKKNDYLGAIIGHEMSHIKRYDNLWMKFQSLLQIIYFFYPLVWFVNSKISLSRECICDQMVLSKKNISTLAYGNGIMAVLKMNLIGADEINVLPGFGSQRKKLIYRIKNLTGEKHMGKLQSKIIYGTLILLGLFLLPMAETMVEKESMQYDSSVFANELQQSETANQDTVVAVKVIKKGDSYLEVPVNPDEVEITKLIVFKNLSFVLPLKYGRVTSGFGNRVNPFTKKIVHHNGIDIAAPKGTEIYTAVDGKIITAVKDEEKKKGPGKHIIIQHAEGCETFYSHLDEVLVKEGQAVKAGEVIGKVGKTGMSKGTHLHFEIRYESEAQDPKNYIDFGKLKRIKKAQSKTNHSKTEIKIGEKTKFASPLKEGRVVSSFGYKVDPFTDVRKFHKGIDIAAKKGTEVYATNDGKVISAVNKNKGYGRSIIIDHKNGYQTLYAHLDTTIVIEGQEVQTGKIIGKVGDTGRAAGDHLHFEIRLNGEPVDPSKHVHFKRK